MRLQHSVPAINNAVLLMMMTMMAVLSSSSIVSVVTAESVEGNDTTTMIDERAILLELFDTTGGHAWNENYGWAENLPDLCTWHGVICDVEAHAATSAEEGGTNDAAAEDRTGTGEGRHRHRRVQSTGGIVQGLKLNSNFLTGRTTGGLWQLPSLVYLDVSYNPQLDVDFVGLSATTSHLEQLVMRHTGTTSVTGLSAAKDTLVWLTLSENSLETQFPADLYELTKLTSLHMSECKLQGSVPDDIHRLSMLHELNVYGNALTGMIPSGLSRLVHLRHLTLSNNQFHGSVPEFFNDMVLMEQFWVSNNDLTGTIPSFHSAPDIFKLYLDGNSFSGDIPEDFLEATLGGPVRKAITVDLSHNEFTGIIPESLDRLEGLEMTWRLGDNKWTGLPSALCDNANWNGGNIAEHGCYGLMCPTQTFNRVGYQTETLKCQECESANYFGSTNCYDKDDRSVLVELYVATGGENWIRHDGWLVGETNVCDWYGITCWDIGDAKEGRVRWVILPNNNLQGEISESIFSIEHMTELDISRNPVTLAFHNIREAFHLYSLNVAGTNIKDFDGIEEANRFFKMLYADQTPIGGTLPKEILQIGHLQVLSMQDCDLKGELPPELFSMTGLQELYLSNNDLQGNLPDLWNTMENLRVLALAMNQFKGPLPTTFDTAPSLKAVSLHDQLTKGGGLSGEILSYATTRTMTKLMLGKNKLEGELPEDLLASVEESTLFTVDLSHNDLTGTVHGSYERFKMLDLYLEGNRIAEIDQGLCNNNDWMSGTVASFGCDAILCPAGTVGGRRQFTNDSCEPCGDGSFVAADGTLSFLGQTSCGKGASTTGEREILELFYSRMGGVGWKSSNYWMTDESICNWYGIDCDENGYVASIQLGSNQLVGTFPTEIYQLKSLVHLKLYGNSIYMNFDGISNADLLQTLSLDSTGLESLVGVGQARSLTELVVGHNKLGGSLPEELSRLINLRTLDVSHNMLAGYLPVWLRGLVSLTTFSASHNSFSGPVSDFSSLSDMLYLDLAFNELSGTIPPTLLAASPVDEKVVVDLSHNKIGGTVPADLSRIPRLSLQLQDNRIVEIDPALCQTEGINDFDTLSFGCSGILCPAGSWNPLGRQSNEDVACEPCDKAEFMGATHCGKSSGSVTQPGAIMITFSAVLGGAVLVDMFLA
jgi:Leucine-rich repeat (LRR) protein